MVVCSFSLATTSPDLIQETEEDKIPFPPEETDLLPKHDLNLRELLSQKKSYDSKIDVAFCSFLSYDFP